MRLSMSAIVLGVLLPVLVPSAVRADSLLVPASVLDERTAREVCLGLHIIDTDNGGLVRSFPGLGCVSAVAHAGPHRAFLVVEATAYPVGYRSDGGWFDLVHVDLDSGAVLARRRFDNTQLRPLRWLRALDGNDVLLGFSEETPARQTRLLRAGLVDGAWTLRADQTVEGEASISDYGDLLPVLRSTPAGEAVDVYRVGDLAQTGSFLMELAEPGSDHAISVEASSGVVHAWTGGKLTRLQSFDARSGTPLGAVPWIQENAVPKHFTHDADGRLLFPFYRRVAPTPPATDVQFLENLVAIDLATLATTSLLTDSDSDFVPQWIARYDDRIAFLQSGQFDCNATRCFPTAPLRVAALVGGAMVDQASEEVYTRPRSKQFLVPALGVGVVASSGPGAIPAITGIGGTLLALLLAAVAMVAARTRSLRAG